MTDSCSKSIVKVWLQSNVIHNGDLKKDKNNRRLDHKKSVSHHSSYFFLDIL